MTREEYIEGNVRQLVASGCDAAVARIVAEVAWHMSKWQYES